MSISYGELAAISSMTSEQLRTRYHELAPLTNASEDVEDERNAILSEMEARGLEHP